MNERIVKDCPFCGGKAIAKSGKSHGAWEGDIWAEVRCEDCIAKMRQEDTLRYGKTHYELLDEVLAAWNRRADAQKEARNE